MIGTFHHEDGTHRWTSRSTSGDAIARHERGIAAHTADGHTHGPAREEWLNVGLEKGWITGFCATHDGAPLTKAEHQEFDEGDPCIPAFRVWDEGEEPGK